MVLEVVKPGWVDGEDFPIFSVDIHPNGQKFATGRFFFNKCNGSNNELFAASM